jgi:hypothetical protein
MDIIDKFGPNGKMIVLITTLSLLTISIILSISALAISLSNPTNTLSSNTSSAVFENDGIILDTKKYKWRFIESKGTGGLCFYATDPKGGETSKSCIEVDNRNLVLKNVSLKR